MRFAALLIWITASLAAAPSAFGPPSVYEDISAVPDGFTATVNVKSADPVVKLRIGLQSKNLQGLADALRATSTPGGSRYGQHLSKEEVKAFVAPATENRASVEAWLTENGVTATNIGAFDEWLSISVPVSKANQLLNADFKTYVHIESGQSAIRTLSYSLPSKLFGVIDTVHPTISFVPPSAKKKQPVFRAASSKAKRDAPDSCAPTANPVCLQQMYGFPATPATSSSNNVLAVAGFIGQHANNADLTTFLMEFRPDMSPDTAFTVKTLDGGDNDQSTPGVEANLDIQYTVGLATGVPVEFDSVGFDTTDGDLEGVLDLADFLNAEENPPTVFTTSYGFDERVLSRSVQRKLCDAYMALTARGVSILYSSGDGGVSGSQPQSCVKNTFIPTFPSGCPYLTSVGATDGITPNEKAAPLSGGGFSNTFPIPDFQSAEVASYITGLGTTYDGQYNKTGRGFPDVAARHNVTIYVGGESGHVSGTSVSSPVFASIISLLNDKLIAAGKPVLGYLNPLLYANPGMFNDVQSGSNPGCNSDGFPAKQGWDPVSGLGTPDFEKMLAVLGLDSATARRK